VEEQFAIYLPAAAEEDYEEPVTRESCRESHELCIEDLPLEAFKKDVASYSVKVAAELTAHWLSNFPGVVPPDFTPHLIGGHNPRHIGIAIDDTFEATKRVQPTELTHHVYFARKLDLLQIEVMETWLYSE
jgi:hypothetical protein